MLDGFAFGGDVVASLGINIKHMRVILLGLSAWSFNTREECTEFPHHAPFGGILLSGTTMINTHYRTLSGSECQRMRVA